MGTKGEKERGQTARQPRITRQEQERRASGGKAGREERREGHGWPRAGGSEEGTRGARQRGEIRQTEKKRYINI